VLLGWTAFGGPAAHIGIFQKEFVQTKRWMSNVVFNELLSLGQCMPGPTSTQVSFAIGVTQKGIPGGLLSGMLFQYPGLMMMSLAGAGAAEVLVNPDGWLRGISAGLSAAGVALVVSAAVGLAVGQCKDQTTSVMCLLSSIVAYYYTRYVLYFPNPNTACRLSRVIMHAPGPKD
jgi:chromate transporter